MGEECRRLGYASYCLFFASTYNPPPEKRQEKLKAEITEAGSLSGDAAATGSVAPPHAGDETAASGAEDAAPKTNAKEAHPPAKKYRLTEPMKSIIWQLVCLSNECCRIENERK
jgi:hypothetical protein